MSAAATIAHSASGMLASDIAIEVEGLSKSFGGHPAVRNLTMRVKRGLIYGFLGPNGSGKTTTIRMLCGLLTPDSGRGTCLGFDIRTDAEKIKYHVGYMTQRFSLYDDLSVRENLEFVARIYGIPRPRAAARAARTRSPAACRAAGSSASRSAPARCRTRSFCCSTSRPRASTRRRGASSGTRSMRSPAKA
jgi:ABC-2 type transport system ATP-binding protein